MFTSELIAWRASRGGTRMGYRGDHEEGCLIPSLHEPREGWTCGGGQKWVVRMVERANGGIGLDVYMQKYI
ncbi:hypothetical protein FIBSPDRAFT_1006360 [Athelia psychrophila]|uniref:Uncharacterized protein n=1 Tax=Athelia psychrophila TaxID=1759441 RepID=A0A167VJI1_9AGAM|nr:hypothetical protein FIBSPDRAFT_1006360 [Fibularhizoctonia sp. CBS 109695]